MVHPSKAEAGLDGLLNGPCAAPSVRRLPGKYRVAAHIAKPDAGALGARPAATGWESSRGAVMPRIEYDPGTLPGYCSYFRDAPI